MGNAAATEERVSVVTTPVRGHQLKWWFALWSVACGLLLMHGFPAAAAGCHGNAASMSMSAASLHDVSTMAMPLPRESLTPASRHVDHQQQLQSPTTHDQCLTTAPRNTRWQLGFAALIGLGMITVLAGQQVLETVNNETRKDRPPPMAGRGLLTQLCVART